MNLSAIILVPILATWLGIAILIGIFHAATPEHGEPAFTAKDALKFLSWPLWLLP